MISEYLKYNKEYIFEARKQKIVSDQIEFMKKLQVSRKQHVKDLKYV